MKPTVGTLLLTTIAFLGMVTTNALANILPINGLNTGQISDLYPSMFTPAGITFSIWTVIYFFLGGFVIYSWSASDQKVQPILPWFILSCLLNITWIMVWHYLLPFVSVLVMLCLLTVLIIVFLKLQNSKNTVKDFTVKTQLWIVLPFTLYLSWICVATIANIAALLVSIHWDGGFLSEATWTILMMCIAAALAIIMTTNFKVPFFAVVVIWALLGIYMRWRSTEYVGITYTSLFLVVLLLISAVYAWRKRAAHG